MKKSSRGVAAFNGVARDMGVGVTMIHTEKQKDELHDITVDVFRWRDGEKQVVIEINLHSMELANFSLPLDKVPVLIGMLNRALSAAHYRKAPRTWDRSRKGAEVNAERALERNAGRIEATKRGTRSRKPSDWKR